MAVEIVKDPNGKYWEVDWVLVHSLIRSYQYSVKLLEHSKIRKSSERGLNPFSWGLPTVYSYETQWYMVETWTEINTKMLYNKWHNDPRPVFMKSKLGSMINATRINRERYSENSTWAARKTMGNIKSSVGTYEKLKTGAEITRDSSAAFLGAGAVFLSGGTAAAVFAGSVGLKGVATYQDTNGNIPAVIIDVTANTITGLIPLSRYGKALSGLEKFAVESALMVVVEVPSEMLKGYVSAKNETDRAKARNAGGHMVLDKLTDAALSALLSKHIKKIPVNKQIREALTSKGESLTDNEIYDRLSGLMASGITTNAKKFGTSKLVDSMYAKKPPKDQNRRSSSKNPRFARQYVNAMKALDDAIQPTYQCHSLDLMKVSSH